MLKRTVLSVVLIGLSMLWASGCGGSDGPSDPGDNNPPVDNPPTASIVSAPSTGTIGEQVTISYSATDDVELEIVSVGWGVLDTPVEIIQVSGKTATGQRSHTYTEAGTVTVTVQVTDTSGKTDSDSRQIEISEPANRLPVATLTVDPTSGIAPLDVRIDLTCSDADGSVVLYELDADGDGTFEVSQATAISIAETYETTVLIRGRCTDDEDAVGIPVGQTVTVTNPFVQISQNGDFACAINSTADAYCWGSNAQGNLGDGSPPTGSYPSMFDRHVPTLVLGDLAFREVQTTPGHACGLTVDGEAYCWGEGSYGQLGTDSVDQSSVPVPVETELRFESLALSPGVTCGITSLGEAYCWGVISEFLPPPPVSSTAIPTPVAPNLTVSKLAVAICYICAVTVDAELYCWGSEDLGQLGDGNQSGFYGQPHLVSDVLRFRDVAVNVGGSNQKHTCAVTEQGAGYCWGHNPHGELGDGSLEDHYSPTAVTGGLSFQSVIPGEAGTCGLTTSGTAYCWGREWDGFLALPAGSGDYLGRVTQPTPVVGGHTFVELSRGVVATCARRSDGHIFCWGSNGAGQLGDGTTTQRREPTPVVMP